MFANCGHVATDELACLLCTQDLFDLAAPASTDPAVNPVLARFSALAKELNVVLPISFFERAGRAHYNSIAVFDADGSCVGLYRKSHIPTGPGYEEKFFFNPVRALQACGWRWQIWLLTTGAVLCACRVTPASKCSRRGSPTLVLPSAGTSGSQSVHERWHYRVPKCCCAYLPMPAHVLGRL